MKALNQFSVATLHVCPTVFFPDMPSSGNVFIFRRHSVLQIVVIILVDWYGNKK